VEANEIERPAAGRLIPGCVQNGNFYSSKRSGGMIPPDPAGFRHCRSALFQSTLNAITVNAESAQSRRTMSNPARGLVLLGTVHSDPRGFSRTRAFLESHNPDLILVEISPFALRFRQERSSELRKTFLEHILAVCKKLAIQPARALKHAQIASIFRQIRIPFEYRASSAYAKSAGIDLIAVDYGEFSSEWIRTWPEMISTENIEQLLQLENTSPPASTLYAQAARKIGVRPFYPETLPGGDTLRWQEREEYMAAQIASALERPEPKRSV